MISDGIRLRAVENYALLNRAVGNGRFLQNGRWVAEIVRDGLERLRLWCGRLQALVRYTDLGDDRMTFRDLRAGALADLFGSLRTAMGLPGEWLAVAPKKASHTEPCSAAGV